MSEEPKMKTLKNLQNKYGSTTPLCSLPDSAFDGEIAALFTEIGFHESSRMVIGSNDWWNLTLAQLGEKLNSPKGKP